MANENTLPEKNNLPDFSLNGPKGVGGWLAFLIVVLTITSPLMNIFTVAKEISDIERENPLISMLVPYIHYKWFCWGIVVITSVISIAVGCMLWKKHEWKIVQLTIGVLWLIGPVPIVLAGMYFWISFGSDMFGGFLKGATGSFVKSIFWASIWTAYLLKSRRVGNTYVRKHP